MKIYISQPMGKGRTKEEILEERRRGIEVAKIYYPNAEFLDTYFEDYDETQHTPMEYFARSAALMAQADLIILLPFYMGSYGCEVEDHIAQVYRIPRLIINYGMDLNGEYNDVHLLK